MQVVHSLFSDGSLFVLFSYEVTSAVSSPK